MNNFLIKITILTLFVFYPSISSASGNGETFRQLELFGDIFEKVRKFYVEDTNDKKLIESFLSSYRSSDRRVRANRYRLEQKLPFTKNIKFKFWK